MTYQRERDFFLEAGRFPGKPDADTRQSLKTSGFRWNRTEGCWSRMLGANAWHWGCLIAKGFNA